jgi:ribose transport system ATP-binding protein/rhamnose transport system ATP-binding protein
VVVGRWLCGQLRVFLVDEPTKGVDVTGKAEILRELRELAAAGVAVMVVSSELEEVADVSDRVLILAGGTSPRIIDGPTTENEILQACFAEQAA